MVTIGKTKYLNIDEVRARLKLSENRVNQLRHKILIEGVHYRYEGGAIFYTFEAVRVLNGRNKKWGRPKKVPSPFVGKSPVVYIAEVETFQRSGGRKRKVE